MSWQETCVMNEKVRFIGEVLEGDYSMSELCSAYKISRKTGYKWLGRYQQFGPAGLEDNSRAPHHHPNEISAGIKSAILAVKDRYPHWGPRKIDYKLRQLHPSWPGYPSLSTIGELLKKHGLVISRRRRHKASPTEHPLTIGIEPNDVWSVDFKGHFKTSDASRCNPLTINDHFSRYLLCCRHLDQMSYECVKRQFEHTFLQYGLPLVIRSDNGTPFSSRGIGGLSRLSLWWIRLGIHPERIEPASPDQNGRHERMHRTLKEQTAKPPAKNLKIQQQKFDSFIDEYNYDRPHEALDMQTPASLYKTSERVFPPKLPRPHYPRHMHVRRVAYHGDIFYKGLRLFLGESFSGEFVGIAPTGEDQSTLWYCDYQVGTINHRKWIIEQIDPHPLLAGQPLQKTVICQ